MKNWHIWTLGLLLLAAPAISAEIDTALVRDLAGAGADWLNENLPPDVKDMIDLPDANEWQACLRQAEASLRSGSLQDAAAELPEVRSVLKHLDADPVTKPYADWLRQRLDYYVVADELARRAAAREPQTPRASNGTEPEPPSAAFVQRPSSPVAPSLPEPADAAFAYDRDMWRQRVALRPAPSEASAMIPTLKKAFAAEGVPPEWVWMAEVESSLDPDATSPSGAVGLFQFMPDTARRFGLRTGFMDERTNPQKSAHAAARYLKMLHVQFGSWPLALAAYNAGEGYLSRTLKAHRASTFDEIVSRLPLQTQMYVPKVLATVHMREGVDPELL